MFMFFGIVGVIFAALLSYQLRREHSFKGKFKDIRDVDDHLHRIEYQRVQNKGIATLTLAIATTANLSLRVERASGFSHWLSNMGIGRDARIGDSILDRDYVFETDDPRVAPWLLEHPEIKEAVRELLRPNAVNIVAHQHRIWCVIQGNAGEIVATPWQLARLAKCLNQIGERIPQNWQSEHVEDQARRAKAMTLLAISFGLALAAILSFYIYFADFAMLRYFPAHLSPKTFYALTMIVWLIPGLLLLRAAARWIGDSARARVVLVELGTVGLLSFLFIGAAYTGKANIAYARAPVQTESVQIIDTVGRPHGRSPSLYVKLPMLAQGSLAASRIRVDYPDYQRYRSGQNAQVRYRRGLFGAYFLLEPPTPIEQPQE